MKSELSKYQEHVLRQERFKKTPEERILGKKLKSEYKKRVKSERK